MRAAPPKCARCRRKAHRPFSKLTSLLFRSILQPRMLFEPLFDLRSAPAMTIELHLQARTELRGRLGSDVFTLKGPQERAHTKVQSFPALASRPPSGVRGASDDQLSAYGRAHEPLFAIPFAYLCFS